VSADAACALAACLSRSRAPLLRSAAMSDWSSGYDPGHPGLPSGAQGFPPQMGGAWLLGQPARAQPRARQKRF
jgi:hypothetical protein